ncbi:hypothetical protein ACFIJ5_13370 [Haloimpatiens sp. FM7330]|uniref:hypothetical protein n=1 Tax=Haloimpatiens sp. FM7330 TaxID=3298610 RepID=UPI00363BB1FC
MGELPNMQGAYNEIKNEDVNIIGIVEDGKDNEKSVKKILKENNITYTNIIPDEKLWDDLVSLVGAFPTSILVNDKGEILKVKLKNNAESIIEIPVLKKEEILDIFNKNRK